MESDPFGDQLTGVMVIAGDQVGRTELKKRGNEATRLLSQPIQLPHLYWYLDCFSTGEYSGAGWVTSNR